MIFRERQKTVVLWHIRYIWYGIINNHYERKIMTLLKRKKSKEQPREKDIFDLWVDGLENRYSEINPEFLKRYVEEGRQVAE